MLAATGTVRASMGISKRADKKTDGTSVKSERVHRKKDVGSDHYFLRAVAKERVHCLKEPRIGQNYVLIPRVRSAKTVE